MRITRSAVLGISVATTVALTLGACSGGGNGETTEPGAGDALDTDRDITLTLAWWGNDDRASKYEESVDLFEEQNPNITVQTQFQAWDDYWTARNTEAAGQALPDVMQMDLSYLRQYGATNQLADLNGQIGVNLDVGGFDEALLASGNLEGGQFGIPTSSNTLALFYNADLLDELGIEPPAEGYTWDEYDAWLTEVSEAGAGEDPVVFGGPDYSVTFWFFLQWLIQQGVEPFTEDGQLGFDEADLTSWLERTQPLRDAGVVYPIERTKQLEPLGGFTVNEAASEFSWDNFLAGYVADSGTDNIQMLPIPSGDDGTTSLFFKPSMLLSSSASSEEPEAAAALIDFLVNDPEVGRIFGTSKGVPAVAEQRDAMEIEPGSVDERVVAYEESVTDQATEAAPIPVEGFGAIEAEFKRLGEELLYETIDIEEFVSQWFNGAASSIPQS
ncbi:ABC transporter substrate-binding protein [Oerskovia flava]|uniref:ABC transporter substrate-binding protein n=1 Tax=Oerskovia flava TaxID=2986422 RepID=UPI00223FD2C1|nr:extracellular solute-binding protein [Oerskovia sp. JB1-3-2]